MLKRIPWRPIVAITVLIATAILFAKYIAGHPEFRQKLSETAPALLVGLLLLYFIFVIALAMINYAAVKLCKSSIPSEESLLITMYSSVINFFGPLQSGPAFRAIYLNKKHRIKLADYTLATFMYYFFYAFFSGLLLFTGILKWWVVPIGIILLLIMQQLSTTKATRYMGFNRLDIKQWYLMAISSFAQVALLAAIFFLEIHSIAPHTGITQALIYTGAANFSLFVSLTPGAIGFRESFLLFSQNLHHIDSATIIAANAIDRTVYVVLLGILALVIFASHAKSRLVIAPAKE
ncbi:MAG: lysylphosphatidylglycerol synthase domain-containing protein [Candidatus Saccharimonadales bacterium]